MGAFHLREGSTILWKENGKEHQGKISEIYCVTVMVSIEGREVIKNGTLENPALLIHTDMGFKRLILYNEIEQVLDISLEM